MARAGLWCSGRAEGLSCLRDASDHRALNLLNCEASGQGSWSYKDLAPGEFGGLQLRD